MCGTKLKETLCLLEVVRNTGKVSCALLLAIHLGICCWKVSSVLLEPRTAAASRARKSRILVLTINDRVAWEISAVDCDAVLRIEEQRLQWIP